MSTEDQRAFARETNEQTAGSQFEKQIDPELEARLAEARRRTPRFLFRGWSNTWDQPSGGYQGLNTTKAITPLAYFRQPTHSSVHSVFEQGREALTHMLLTHLQFANWPPTQFSSWAASLSVAFGYAQGSNSYIGVIDTRLLPRDNFVAHVPTLDFLLQQGSGYYEEYLAHGVIDGACYKAIPVAKFTNVGLPDDGLYPYGDPSGSPAALSERSESNMKHRWYNALKIAKRYGRHFTLAVFLGIVCLGCKHFAYSLNIKRLRHDINSIVGLADRLRLHVPLEWVSDPSIMEADVVNTQYFVEVKIMLLCMRLLVLDRYPMVAKKRWPGLTREGLLTAAKIEDQLRAELGVVNDEAGVMDYGVDAEGYGCNAVDWAGDAGYYGGDAADWAGDAAGWAGGAAGWACDAADWSGDAAYYGGGAADNGGGATGADSDETDCGWDTSASDFPAKSKEAGALDSGKCC